MVAIKDIRTANAALKTKHESLTAVFVGATAGIGLATLQAFAKHVPKPYAIIVGRSQSKFAPEIEKLKTINPNGEYEFLEADISLLKNIDAVSAVIKTHLASRSASQNKIDLLYVSQGYISFVGREDNADGLDNSTSLRYYGRVRFAQNLLPLTSPHARVISILAGGKEGKIFEDDLELKQNYSIVNSAGQMASMMSLSFDYLAAQNTDKGFLHVFPGLVNTGTLGRSNTGLLGMLMRWIVEPVVGLFSTSLDETGERMLFYGTSSQFEKGCWTLDWDGTAKEEKALVEYRQRGMEKTVWEHTQKEFDRIISA